MCTSKGLYVTSTRRIRGGECVSLLLQLLLCTCARVRFWLPTIVFLQYIQRLYGPKSPALIAVRRLQVACALLQQLFRAGGSLTARPSSPRDTAPRLLISWLRPTRLCVHKWSAQYTARYTGCTMLYDGTFPPPGK